MYLYTNKILNSNKFGLIKGQSTVSAFYSFLDTIVKFQDNKEYTAGVFFFIN